MRQSIATLLVLPLLIAGCGGSKESAEVAKTASPSPSDSTRATVSFTLYTGVSSGRAVLSPTTSDAYYQYYEGTWNGQKIRFAEGQGVGAVTIWNGNLAVASYTFSSYRISDFPTVTKQSINGQYSYYDSNLRTQIKFKLAPATASP